MNVEYTLLKEQPLDLADSYLQLYDANLTGLGERFDIEVGRMDFGEYARSKLFVDISADPGSESEKIVTEGSFLDDSAFPDESVTLCIEGDPAEDCDAALTDVLEKTKVRLEILSRFSSQLPGLHLDEPLNELKKLDL